MLRNPASSAKCNLQEGETGEVPAGQAEWLVAMGLAVLVHPKKIKAIPEPAALMAAEPSEAESAAATEETKPPGNPKKSR